MKFNIYPMKNSTILRLYHEKNEIDTKPEYQRNSGVWNMDNRQLLIDSVLNEYDLPKIYIHSLDKPRILSGGREVIYAVIDGKQRLETIWGFMNGDFCLADDFKYYKDPSIKIAGLTYEEIGKKYLKLKVIFDSYVLPIICVETEDIDMIEEMFSRLNDAVPLNAAEKRNALGGPMPRMISETSEHIFFTTKVRFKNVRYQHREVVVKLLFLEDTIGRYNKVVDTKKAYLDWFVKEYKQESKLNAIVPGNEVKKVLNEMNHLFIEKDELLEKTSIVPVYYLLFRQALKQGRITDITRDKLIEFRESVANNREIAEKDISKANFELLEFDRMSVQGTNDASSIKERLKIIANFFNINGLKF